MSKKKLVLIIFFIATIFLLLVFYRSYLHKKTENEYAIMPDLILANINGSNTNIKSHDGNWNNYRILNYFNPNCEHCENMAKILVANKTKISASEIFMITNADSITTKKFENRTGITELNNVKILLDKQNLFLKHFNYPPVPSFFIYKNNILIKKIFGEIKVENIILN